MGDPPKAFPASYLVTLDVQLHYCQYAPEQKPQAGNWHKVQRSAKRDVRGLVKFVPAVAYLLCLALLG